MKRKTGTSPYSDFKNDSERRRALNSLAWSKAALAIAAALATALDHGIDLIRWLMGFVRVQSDHSALKFIAATSPPRHTS